MSLFKKLVKGSSSNSSNTSQQSMHTNEEKGRTLKLEEQIKHLNSYIQELVRENEALQNRASDMKTTLVQNKQLLSNLFRNIYHWWLDDYINTAGHTDQMVSKLKHEIDELRATLQEREDSK